MSDYYKYLQPTTDVVAYAWNAAIVCRDCTRKGLLSFDEVTVRDRENAPQDVELVREFVGSLVFHLPPERLGDLDTNEFPYPVTAGEDGADEESCNNCLQRIKDTY